MKSKHIALLSILLSQTTPLWAVDSDDEAGRAGKARPAAAAQKPTRKETKVASNNEARKAGKARPAAAAQKPTRKETNVALLRDSRSRMEEAVAQTLETARKKAPKFYEKKVFVIGETGHGKTTFLHAVAGVPLDVIESPDGVSVDLGIPPERMLPGLKISHTNEVGTIKPGAVVDVARQAVFIDCLGFGDPRGPVEDIPNAIGMKKLFEPGTRAKVLLVIDQAALLKKRGGAVKLFNQVAESFPDDVVLTDHVRLIVTKAAQGYNPPHNLKDLMTVKDSRGAELSPRAKILCNSFLQPNRIFKFLAPVKGAPYAGFDSNAFSTVLGDDDGYILNPRVTPVLSADAKVLIGETVDELRDEGQQFLEAAASDRIQTICENMVNDGANPNRTIAALRTQLKALRNDILALKTMDDFKGRLHRIIGDNTVSGQDNAGQLTGGIVQNVEFLRELHPRANTPQDSWRAALAPIARAIESLATDSVITEANGIVSLRGKLPSIEEVITAKQRYPQSTLIKVFASHNTLANADIQNGDYSLALFSPELDVTRNTAIDVSGRRGPNGTVAGANGGHGTPGQNVLIKVRNAAHLDRLSIFARGGNGGNGINGVAGTHGADGDLNLATHHPGERIILPGGWGHRNGGGHTAEGHFISSDDLRWGLSLKYTRALYHAAGSPGIVAGPGGQGGQGAPGGTVRIVGAVGALAAVDVTGGIAGSHGTGGTAGSTGSGCVGEEYVNRHLSYKVLTGHDGPGGDGTYRDGRIDLDNKTITPKRHLGSVPTAAGYSPTVPHGNVPAAIPAIDEAALDAEYADFLDAERSDPAGKRFVR